VKEMMEIEKLKKIKKYEEVDFFVNDIIGRFKEGLITKKEISALVSSFGDDFFQNTVQGHGYLKPYGYAGDFEIIDNIYTLKTNPHLPYKVWDEYFHRQSAPKAVRNRKAYFKKIISMQLKTGKLLNIASGPGRDLYELYNDFGANGLKCTCVEIDGHAIDYSRKLNSAFLSNIDFVQKNVFRYRPAEKYDIIWSAGLFDYFDNRAFELLLRRFSCWLNEGGEIIVGNFNEDHNPSRLYMELFGDWYLFHRSEEQLIELAKKAGFDDKQISVGREPENVNLFLHIRN